MHVKCSIQTLETQSAVERIARAGRERQRQYTKFELCEYPQPVLPATTNCLKWVWTITSRSTKSMRSGREGNSQSSYLLFFLFLLVRGSGCVSEQVLDVREELVIEMERKKSLVCRFADASAPHLSDDAPKWFHLKIIHENKHRGANRVRLEFDMQHLSKSIPGSCAHVSYRFRGWLSRAILLISWNFNEALEHLQVAGAGAADSRAGQHRMRRQPPRHGDGPHRRLRPRPGEVIEEHRGVQQSMWVCAIPDKTLTHRIYPISRHRTCQGDR